MKRILIDGYNLLNSYGFEVPEQLDLEGKRDYLVRVLQSYACKEGLKVILVFDSSQRQIQHPPQNRQMQIIFSRPGQEADDIIKRKIRQAKNAALLTVVSSDRAIRFSAKEHSVTWISSEAFCSILRRVNSRDAEVPPLSTKYDADISEEEVQFWKGLFEQDQPDE